MSKRTPTVMETVPVETLFTKELLSRLEVVFRCVVCPSCVRSQREREPLPKLLTRNNALAVTSISPRRSCSMSCTRKQESP